MRLTTRGIVYHPDRTPNIADRHCFSIEGVESREFADALLSDLVPGQEVGLTDPLGDCSRQIRRATHGFQTKLICHGSLTDAWHDATRQQAMDWLLPAVECMVRLKIADGWLYGSPADATS